MRRCRIPARIAFLTAVMTSVMHAEAMAAQFSGNDSLEQVTLQLGWQHQFEFAGYYAAQEMGYYADVGLDVRFQAGGMGKSCINIMVSGQAHYCADDADNIFYYLKGQPIMALAVIFQLAPSALIVRSDSDLKTPRDLIGKRVEIMHGGIPFPEIHAMFNREGISLDMLDIREDSFGIELLKNGEVDAMYGFASNETRLLKEAGIPVRLIRPRNYGIDFYGDALFTTYHEAENHPERVKAFRAASLKGWDYALKHKEEIANLIHEKYNANLSLDHLLYEAQTFENLMQADLVEIGHMNSVRWRHMADVLTSQGGSFPNLSLDQFIYDPNHKPDYTQAVIFLTIVAGCAGIGIVVLMRYNARLAREVEDRKRAEVALARAKEESESANREKSRFLAAASHDLRQPIHTMSLLLVALEDRLKSSAEQTYLTKIHGSLGSLSSMLNGLLDMSRLENDAIVPQADDFPVQNLLEQMRTEYEPFAVAKGLSFHVSDSNLSMYTDAGLLARIVGNFISNAIRYTDQGTVSVLCREQEDLVRIEVQDTGCGIESEDLAQIFEQYRRLETGTMRAAGGLGLGLSIATGLAQLLDLQIDVDSSPGKGSVFSVAVPRGDAYAKISADKQAEEETSSPFRGHTLMVIDDDPSVLGAMQMLLEGWGAKVIGARNVTEAIAKGEKASKGIQALLADYHLAGDETGLEVREALTQAIGREIPTIIISGNTDPQLRRDIEARGCSLITKPVQPVALKPALRRLLTA